MKNLKKYSPENRRLIIYAAVLVFALLFWVLMNYYGTIPQPSGRFSGNDVLLWKYETSFENKDMEYVKTVLPFLCNSYGDEKCKTYCSGQSQTECSIDETYINTYEDPETGQNILRLFVTIKGNTNCRCVS